MLIPWFRRYRQFLGLWSGLGLLVLVLGIGGCAIPQVSAEERLFLDLSVDYIDQVILPAADFAGTEVGGLSAITYDRDRSCYYALSDDRQAPRVYTLKLELSPQGIAAAQITAVTPLTAADGGPLAPFDGEGMALTPQSTLMVSSEGIVSQQANPSIQEFDLATGRLLQSLRIPRRYLPDEETPQTQGIQENIGFEALTISAPGGAYEPFRLFVATEGPLRQDLDTDPEIPYKNRWLHYLIGPDQSTLIAEHWYPMDTAPLGAIVNGLSEIAAIDSGGHFLSLERAYGLQGLSIRLYQLATGGASDTSAIVSLSGDISGISPIRKRLLADLTASAPDNLEAMTLGPRLADGSQSLILASDNNFDPRQTTQIRLLTLQGLS